MSDERSAQPSESVTPAALIAVALIAAALISFEIVLMRRLVIERWHHFGYLAISTALLGFGASGTLLALARRRVHANPRATFIASAASFALALLLVPRLVRWLPVSTQIIPSELVAQLGWWGLYWALAAIPFVVGATFLGAALMVAGRRVRQVYAANLLGSGVGALGAALLIARFAIDDALYPSVALAILATGLVALYPDRPRPRAGSSARVSGVLLLCVAAIVLELLWPLPPKYDAYKYAAALEQLAAQGDARRVAARSDPHGYVELYESDLFHDLPFLALTEAPPPMYALVVNGNPAGSVLRITAPEEASAMDGTLMALPYALIPPRPRVLLIGETGGANIWLARKRGAAQIDAVQPNAAVIEIVTAFSPALEQHASFHARDPRTFLASLRQPAYDLLQIVTLEGLGGGAAGARGLAEDHLATVEGFAACLRALSADGVLAVSRGVQQPPRENIKIFATLIEALESLGIEQPGRHVIQVRDYLGVCTIALRRPLDDLHRSALRAAIRDFNLTPVWYAGLPETEVNRPDALDGPDGSHIDWLHHAAREILSPRREAFYRSWLMNVRPARDDRPFFWDFYTPQSVRVLRAAYGPLWLTRAELGRLFLYASLTVSAAVAIGLILLPLFVTELRRGKRGPEQVSPRASPRGIGFLRGVLATIVYFGGIGVGFMAIEMTMISRAIHYLGDPVIASALVIGGVLVAGGVGSLLGTPLIGRRSWLAPTGVAVAALVIGGTSWSVTGNVAVWLLLAVSIVLALLMGVPMPVGITALNASTPRLVPWAWGINGVASVIATSAAVALAMSFGYTAVLWIAVLSYAAAAVAGGVVSAGRSVSERD